MQNNLHSSTGNQFTNYTATSVTVNNREYTTNIIVTNLNIYNSDIISIDDLVVDDIVEIISNQPDIIIFGTGNKISMPNNEILLMLQQKQIGFEVMPIAALCRTFNYLVGEGRNVVGILIF